MEPFSHSKYRIREHPSFFSVIHCLFFIFLLNSYSPVNHWTILTWNSVSKSAFTVFVSQVCVVVFIQPSSLISLLFFNCEQIYGFFSLYQVVACRIYATRLCPLGVLRLTSCQSLIHLQRRLSAARGLAVTASIPLLLECCIHVKSVPDETLWQILKPASVLPGKRQRSRGDFIPWNLFYNVYPCPSFK